MNIKLFLLIYLSVLLAGCATPPPPQYSDAALSKQTATGVQIRDSDIGVPQQASIEYIRVKTEKSIFLDPPEGNTKVYVRIGDTSGREWGGVDMRQSVAAQLKNRGFNPVSNAKDAAYTLQVNILLADEISAAGIAKIDETKYGQGISDIIPDVIGGVLAGGVVGSLLGDSDDALLGGVVGGLAGGVLKGLGRSKKDKLLKAQQQTKYFSIIMDVVVGELVAGGGKVTRSGAVTTNQSQNSSTDANLADTETGSGQNISSIETETFSDQSKWKRHRTRIIGKAKGKLVVFEDVEQDFATKMVRAIAGFF